MIAESKQTAEISANPLNGRLTRIEKVSPKHPSGYILHLDSGIKINLPPESIPTVKKVHFGDKFELSPREDLVEGELKKFDDQTRISVKRTNLSSLEFIVTNNCIVSSFNKNP